MPTDEGVAGLRWPARPVSARARAPRSSNVVEPAEARASVPAGTRSRSGDLAGGVTDTWRESGQVLPATGSGVTPGSPTGPGLQA